MSPSDPSPVSTEPPRFRFRFPHWGWFLLATVALVITAVGVSIWLPYYREQQVVEKIKSWDRFNSHYIGTETGGPEWLRRILGKDRLKKIKVFERVVNVELPTVPIPDSGLVDLSRLTNLQDLNLDGTATDAGLAHLSGMTKLRRLSLIQSPVTGAGLAHLSGLTNLSALELNGTKVTDAGLANLIGCINLDLVTLSRTPVTDKGLAQLSRLKNLASLFLDGTAVTDQGLAHLSGCSNLKRLSFRDTAVTDEGVAELKKSLPACKIDH